MLFVKSSSLVNLCNILLVKIIENNTNKKNTNNMGILTSWDINFVAEQNISLYAVHVDVESFWVRLKCKQYTIVHVSQYD